MPTKKLTPTQMAKRNAKIVKLASKGKHSIEAIATEVGLSKTRIREIIKTSVVG